MAWIIRVAVVVVLLAGPADATDYYVATNGSNSNSGTLAQPFQTIQRAADMAQANDNVYIMGGTYRETVTVNNSGTAGAPINFRPYAGQQVTVTGLDLLSGGWTNYSGSIYSSTLSGNPGSRVQLFVNGKVMTEARWPNAGYNNPLHTSYATVDSASVHASPQTSTITSAALGNPSNGYWNGSRMAIVSGLGWRTYSSAVTSQTGNTLSFQWNGPDAGDNPHADPTSGNRYFLYGSLNALSAAKEYYYDPTGRNVYLYAPGGADPSTQTVEIRRRQNAFNLNGSYVNLSGLQVKAASVSVQGNHNQISNFQILYPDAFYPQASVDDPNPPDSYYGLKFAPGVTIRGQYNTLSRSEIANTWGSGVTLADSYNTVDNNVIHDVNWYGSENSGVTILAGNNTITHNTIYNSGRNGVATQGQPGYGFKNLTIQHNDISNFGYLTQDLGGIYTYTADASGTVISYNKVHDGRSAGQINVGIYVDDVTSGVTVHHNLITNVWSGLIRNGQSDDTNFYNNTIWASGRTMTTPTAGFMTNCKTYNNLGNTSEWYGTDIQNNVTPTSDPFVNSAAGDYRLRSGTAPVDAGRVIPGITDGYVGSAPDAGAFEYATTAWTAGANFKTWLLPNQISAPLANAATVTPSNVRTTTGSLIAGNIATTSSTNRRAFINFDLSGISNQPIAGAMLRIYENTMPLSATGSVALYRITSAWTPTDVSYSQSGSLLASGFYDPANLDFYTEIDVTSTVAAWLADPSTNFGFSLRGTAESSGWSAKEFGGYYDITGPQLLITYVPEPSAVALLATGLIGLLCYAWRKRK